MITQSQVHVLGLSRPVTATMLHLTSPALLVTVDGTMLSAQITFAPGIISQPLNLLVQITTPELLEVGSSWDDAVSFFALTHAITSALTAACAEHGVDATVSFLNGVWSGWMQESVPPLLSLSAHMRSVQQLLAQPLTIAPPSSPPPPPSYRLHLLGGTARIEAPDGTMYHFGGYGNTDVTLSQTHLKEICDAMRRLSVTTTPRMITEVFWNLVD